MGQAKRRGSFELRKAEAIQREQERAEAQRLWELEHPRPPSRPSKMLPFFAAMMLANTFPYYPPSSRCSKPLLINGMGR
jgi:hypothetical protein